MVYFISDAHLGTEVKVDFQHHLTLFINLLVKLSIDATHIFFLGDIFDFWFEYYWCDRSKKKYFPLFETIKKIIGSGVEVHFLIGNHDLWTFGYLAKVTGMIIHKKPLEVEFFSKRIFMSHGDGLLPSSLVESITHKSHHTNSLYTDEEIEKIRRFMHIRAVFHNPICQSMFRILPPILGNWIGGQRVRKSRMKELLHPFHYKGGNREELILYAIEREKTTHFDYYIFGHRHISLDYPIFEHNAHVIFLGECYHQWTYAALGEDGQVNLHKAY